MKLEQSAHNTHKSEATIVELERRCHRLARTLVAATECTLFVDSNGVIREVHTAALRIADCETPTLCGRPLQTLLPHLGPNELACSRQTADGSISFTDPPAEDACGQKTVTTVVDLKAGDVSAGDVSPSKGAGSTANGSAPDGSAFASKESVSEGSASISEPGSIAYAVVLHKTPPQIEELEKLRRQNLMYAADLARTYARWKDGVRRIRTTAKQAAQAERLSVLGQMAAGLAHEAKNLLMPVTLYAQLLSERRADLNGEGGKLVDGIQEAAGRVSQLLYRILDAGRPTGGEREPIHLSELVENVRSIMGSALKKHGVALEVSLPRTQGIAESAPPLPRVEVNRQEIEQVLVNLIANALDVLADHTLPPDTDVATHKPCIQLHLGLEESTVPAQSATCGHPTDKDASARVNDAEVPVVIVRVIDNGPGIAQDVLPRIFDPFFTTKSPKEGTGLGLFMAHETIRNHGGTLDAYNVEPTGACFEIRLPAVPDLDDAPPALVG